MSHPNDLVQSVINAAQVQRGTGFNEELRVALNALADQPYFEEARLEVATQLPLLESPVGAGCLAIWFGAGVENGADPMSTGPFLIEALLKWSRTLEDMDDDDDIDDEIDEADVDAEIDDDEIDDDEIDESEPDADVLQGLQMLGQGTVAHLIHSVPLREKVQSDAEALNELARTRHISIGINWVWELFQKRSGTLLVIHVESRKAVRVSFSGISNCFHLFTLLQHELAGKVPGARRGSSQLMEVATGQSTELTNDAAVWHYGRGDVAEADLMASIWGEGSTDEIPVVHGERIILLWPMVMESRSWNSGFFSPVLLDMPPMVEVIEVLPEVEAQQWCDRLSLPTLQKPWWKFW